MNRSSPNEQGPIIHVDTIKDIEPAIRDLKGGRYDVDEISAIRCPEGALPRTASDDGPSFDTTIVLCVEAAGGWSKRRSCWFNPYATGAGGLPTRRSSRFSRESDRAWTRRPLLFSARTMSNS